MTHRGASKRHERAIVDRYLHAIDKLESNREAVAPALVDEFVRVLPSFSDRFNISYDAWLDVGVPRAVLARAWAFDLQESASNASADAGRPSIR